jgi:polygalacturonase
LNVKDIGAVGDCRHDDTAVISKALAMHDVVFLPATAGQVSFFRPCLSDYLS